MAQLPATRGQQGGRMATRREHPLEQLRRDFDSLFGQLWGGWLSPYDEDFQTMRVWDFDVKEQGNEFVVRAEMPGFDENEIDVQLHDNILTIRAEKVQHERGREESRTFFRSVALPAGTDTEKVTACYHNGVLELHIPRAESAQPRRIKLQGHQAAGQPGATQQAQAGQTQTEHGTTGSPEKAQKTQNKK